MQTHETAAEAIGAFTQHPKIAVRVIDEFGTTLAVHSNGERFDVIRAFTLPGGGWVAPVDAQAVDDNAAIKAVFHAI